ncbi:MAG: hypothetical protein II157_02725 [Bacteroidales bacterium]|nr:hypothetical protein [Bacteroidales bacterium]
MKRLLSYLLFAAVLLSASSCKEILFTQGSSVVDYACHGPFEGKTVKVYYHIPDGETASMPVLFVMHGMDRNGDEYRDQWKDQADKYGFIVLVPTFSEDQFPDDFYQRGNVTSEDNTYNPEDERVYVLIDEVFNYFTSHSASKATSFSIYGHSAGAQFVHRYLLFNPTPHLDRAVAANAGWYTYPSDTVSYPYGTKGSGADAQAYFGKHMIILLGDADTLRTSSLRQTPETDAQGLTRLDRGNAFFSFCKREADRNGYEFNWRKEYVEHVGHSNTKMAPAAAALLFNGSEKE